MNRIRFLQSAAIAAVLCAPVASPPVHAQEVVAAPNPEADRLSEQVRILAENPRDLQALLTAGEISARLNDSAAALAFFARAEELSPENARLYAGRGSALVRIERPAEALVLFQQAEAHGLGPAAYASDRGLAYDLLGAPQLAQPDYKLALSRGADDETVRRYALSLGIAGKQREAMQVLDPLLRKSDRAAWRARAFIMAMNGDIDGAEAIAQSMMPGNMGGALTPFFRKIAAMSPADRAFAVHFGALTPSQVRVADAQFAPKLPAFRPDAEPPVQVAAATPAPRPAPTASRADRREARNRRKPPTPAPQPLVVPSPSPSPSPTPAPPPVQLAMATPAPIPAPEPAPVIARPEPQPEPARRESPPVTIVSVPQPSLSPALSAAPPPAPAPAPAPAPSRIGAEDSALDAIMKNITIPASELGVAPMPGEVREEAAPAPAPPPVAAPEPEPAKAEPPKPEPKPEAKPAPKPAKKDPPKPDPKKLEPSRVWVQVAGGANEKALPLTWSRLIKQAPAAFKGKSPWWTPVNATNRLLVGPFKNKSVAQDFVNLLAKSDMSGFVFTSDAGQKITKLDTK